MFKRLRNLWKLSGYDIIPIDSETVTLTKEGKQPQAQIIQLLDPLDKILNDSNGETGTNKP